MIKWLLAGQTLLLLACNGGRRPPALDGGPCRYKTSTREAVLIALPDINTQEYDAKFVVKKNAGEGNDTFLFSFFNNYHYLRSDELPKDSLVIGKAYTYEEQQIVTGSCNPHITNIRLEPYQPQ